MAEFLSTTATNYRLEELIKTVRERLILITPYLKVNDRIKELIVDKDRLKIDMRLVYGKSELQPKEIAWIQNLDYLRTSFCQHLHAKCYLNEEAAIITSMNLYEFSQVNNNEMGVFIQKSDDPKLYADVYDEALRIIRTSEEIRLSAETVREPPKSKNEPGKTDSDEKKLTTSKLAQRLGMKTCELEKVLIHKGFLEEEDGKLTLTEQGQNSGAESKYSHFKKDTYFLWSETFAEELSMK